MSNNGSSPKLWSDFDGTAVEKHSWHDPRNWLKYPLNGKSGYSLFLDGVIKSGIEVAGIVTARKPIRRKLTELTLREAGLDRYFGDPPRVTYAGNEENKGRFLVEQSRKAVIGMTEDNPQKLGQVLIGALVESMAEERLCHNPIVLGVTAHPAAQQKIDVLLEGIDAATGLLEVREPGNGTYQVYGPSMQLDIVPLCPYSSEEGNAFANYLRAAADQQVV